MLLWLIAPEVPINGTDPCIKPEIASEVVVADVMVAFVAKRLVLVADVSESVEPVALEKEREVALRLVDVLFVNAAFVAKRLVLVLLLITDEEARSVPGSVSVFTALL